MVVEAVAVRVVEPGRLDRLPVGQPLLTGSAVRQRRAQRVLGVGGLDRVRDAELERPAGEAAELAVGAEQDDVDPADHLRDRLIGDVGEALLAQLVEHEVRRVAKVQELEVVLPDAVDALEQPVVGDQQRVRRADPAALGDDRAVLDLGQVGHLERRDLADRVLHLRLPPAVEVVPVLEVEPGALAEQLRAAADLGLVGDAVGAHVHPAVQHAMIDPERGRNREDPRVRLAEAHVRRVGGDEVEREHRLGEVHPVAEPAARLLGLAPLLAEQRVVRIHRLPALAPVGDRHLERAREAADLGLCRRHLPLLSLPRREPTLRRGVAERPRQIRASVKGSAYHAGPWSSGNCARSSRSRRSCISVARPTGYISRSRASASRSARSRPSSGSSCSSATAAARY